MIDIAAIKSQVERLFEDQLSPLYTYHSAGHTKDVVRQSMIIADAEGLSDPHERNLLESAAWLHDTGFTRRFREHEQASCDIAREMLTALGTDQQDIDRVCDLIIATRIPQSPTSRTGEILCDADLDYLGREDFDKISSLLCEEWYHFGVIRSRQEFATLQIRFLENHHYFTSYSRQHRQAGKFRRLQLLKAA